MKMCEGPMTEAEWSAWREDRARECGGKYKLRLRRDEPSSYLSRSSSWTSPVAVPFRDPAHSAHSAVTLATIMQQKHLSEPQIQVSNYLWSICMVTTPSTQSLRKNPLISLSQILWFFSIVLMVSSTSQPFRVKTYHVLFFMLFD